MTTITSVNQIERSLRSISGMLKQKGREILTNYPITPPQFQALQWLKEKGDLTIGELSHKLYLACSTTTDLVDRLEKNDLVRRVRDENDRRVVRIHIMDEGMRVITEVIEKRQAYLADILNGFEEADIPFIAKVLEKLDDSMAADRTRAKALK
ncbi:DNA-binding MarR family transcriptional regulator [Aureibacillus halotolerans]|uniref:DNA-binding MarR family transcriptional regulator n=2 Tax=Aureibacillus halotolerans TaxID=1508390 RepID=A0A4R6U800_9BACI|nr:DNA-binding MarR family transcriptional regulator [Aureibacillus halotolerans]